MTAATVILLKPIPTFCFTAKINIIYLKKKQSTKRITKMTANKYDGSSL